MYPELIFMLTMVTAAELSHDFFQIHVEKALKRIFQEDNR